MRLFVIRFAIVLRVNFTFPKHYYIEKNWIFFQLAIMSQDALHCGSIL